MSESMFLSSGHDNTVRLWDVRVAEHQRLLKDVHFGQLTWLQKYSPNVFATACQDGLVNVSEMLLHMSCLSLTYMFVTVLGYAQDDADQAGHSAVARLNKLTAVRQETLVHARSI